MIEELEKQIAWQNINTSEEQNKILTGKAIAIENEKVKLTHEDGKIYEDNINCIVINFKNIKVLIPGKELGLEKDDKKNIRNLIGSEIKFIILESDKLTNLNNLYQVGDKIKVKIKEIDEEKEILKISHKETKDDPYKNIRKNFTEGGEYLAKVTGFSDNRNFCNIRTRNRYNGNTSCLA